MSFGLKLIPAEQNLWRGLNAPRLRLLVHAGARFEEGLLVGHPAVAMRTPRVRVLGKRVLPQRSGQREAVSGRGFTFRGLSCQHIRARVWSAGTWIAKRRRLDPIP
jgi:hypothetical protein